jgi:hypothetical protein
MTEWRNVMSLDYGIEIEFLVPTAHSGGYRDLGAIIGPRIAAAIEAVDVPCYYAGYSHVLDRRRWKIVTDGSLYPPAGYTGLELVSPPMNEEGFGQIEKVCRVIEESFNATVNKSCGLHVHIGARHMSVNAMRRLAMLYAENEDIIDNLLPASRRRNNNTYCRSLKLNVNLDRLLAANSVQAVADAATQSRATRRSTSPRSGNMARWSSDITPVRWTPRRSQSGSSSAPSWWSARWRPPTNR